MVPYKGWPRQHFPFLPVALREAWSSDLVPDVVVERVGLPAGTTMADLDDTIWATAKHPERLDLLGNYVVQIVDERLYQKNDLLAVNSPVLGSSIASIRELKDLGLSPRIENRIIRGKHIGDDEWFLTVTAAELLSIIGFGSRSLLELSTALEVKSNQHHDKSAVIDHVSENPVVLRARRIAEDFPIEEISSEDPRFRFLKLKGRTLHEFLGYLASDQGALDKMSAAQEESLGVLLENVEDRLEFIHQAPLDEQLEALLTTLNPRHFDAMKARFGWHDGPIVTLERAGAISGVTRERVRQIEKKIMTAFAGVTYLPMLDKAIIRLIEFAKESGGDPTETLVADKILSKKILPGGIKSAAEIFGRDIELEVTDEGRTVFAIGSNKVNSKVIGSLSDIDHVALIEEFAERVIQERSSEGLDLDISIKSLENWITAHESSVWLDSDKQWFWVRQKEGLNAYVNIARKVLAVAKKTTVRALREGIVRDRKRRAKVELPPTHALVGLFRQSGFTVEDGLVESEDPLTVEGELGQIETTMFEVLRDADNVMGLYAFQDECVKKRGMNLSSFYAYLTYSPIIERIERGIHALRSCHVDPARVGLLMDGRPPRNKIVIDHGWDEDSRLWIAAMVSPAMRASGVLNVPVAVQDIVGLPRDIDLIGRSSERAMGVFRVQKSGVGTGLRTYMDRRGVDVGDILILTFDHSKSFATIETTTEEMFYSSTDQMDDSSTDDLESANIELSDRIS